MPGPATAEELKATLEDGKAKRLEGNEHLRAGDIQKALASYYAVIFSLKGLDSSIQTLFTEPKVPPPASTKTGEGQERPKTFREDVNDVIALTHLNMSICFLKSDPPKYKRALESAQACAALGGEKPNPKATYREALARIGLGEISKGKMILQELMKTNPDSAIQAALKKIETDEKAGRAKTDARFKGMYTKKPAAMSAAVGLPAAKNKPGSEENAKTTEAQADV